MKVNTTRKKWIAIGIIDSKENNRVITYLDDSPNILCYHDNGEVEEGKKGAIKKEGCGISEGDVVKVKTDMKMGTIAWEVNGVEQVVHKTKKLKDKTIKWVPYVELYYSGDCVEFLS